MSLLGTEAKAANMHDQWMGAVRRGGRWLTMGRLHPQHSPRDGCSESSWDCNRPRGQMEL